MIDALGDNAAETLLDIMRFVFFDTDYVAKACPATVEYPCVTFSDVTDSAGVPSVPLCMMGVATSFMR